MILLCLYKKNTQYTHESDINLTLNNYIYDIPASPKNPVHNEFNLIQNFKYQIIAIQVSNHKFSIYFLWPTPYDSPKKCNRVFLHFTFSNIIQIIRKIKY